MARDLPFIDRASKFYFGLSSNDAVWFWGCCLQDMAGCVGATVEKVAIANWFLRGGAW